VAIHIGTSGWSYDHFNNDGHGYAVNNAEGFRRLIGSAGNAPRPESAGRDRSA
jgi:uncharacterized protein YecE (DUF72 family)